LAFIPKRKDSNPVPTKIIPVTIIVPVGTLYTTAVATELVITVKMLTPEQLIFVRLRGLTKISQNRGERDSGNAATTEMKKPVESAFEIEADNSDSFAPLSTTGRWKRTKLPRKVSLYLDGVPRAGAEALATPVSDTESGYTIVSLPTVADIGLRELEVRVEGEEKPIYKKKVEVKVRGARSLEMKKVG